MTPSWVRRVAEALFRFRCGGEQGYCPPCDRRLVQEPEVGLVEPTDRCQKCGQVYSLTNCRVAVEGVGQFWCLVCATQLKRQDAAAVMEPAPMGDPADTEKWVALQARTKQLEELVADGLLPVGDRDLVVWDKPDGSRREWVLFPSDGAVMSLLWWGDEEGSMALPGYQAWLEQWASRSVQ